MPVRSKINRPHYYDGLQDLTGAAGRWSLAERWLDLGGLLTLRADDRVLDVGCAEGLITFEVAKQVRQVDAFEVLPERIDLAERLRLERGVSNIRFDVASVVDLDIPELSYDVVLFLGVIQHLPASDQRPSLEKLLRATRREIAIRAPQHVPSRCPVCSEIGSICKQHGFIVSEHSSGGRAGELFLATRPESASASPKVDPAVVSG